MGIPFLSSSRSVLLLGDEALQVYKAGFTGTKLVEVVPWELPNFEQTVSNLISRDCGGAPVVMINDMVEQHYRKERIPKVSPLDRARIVKRRLSVAFPNYAIRAALKIDEKKSRKDKREGLAGNLYLMAAIPVSEAFQKTMEAVKLSMASVEAFCLLPLETTDLVTSLARRVAKRTSKKARWVVFIGQHHNGGLRQVVTKDGDLALTRMTPIIDTDIEPDLWVKEVVSEFKATMSYLSRFGYASEDGLEVIVIANQVVQSSFDKFSHEINGNLHILDVQQAAYYVGKRIGRQEDLRYADPLHVAWCGRKKSFTLPMQAPQIDRVSQPRKRASFFTFILFLTALVFGAYSYYEYENHKLTQEQLELAYTTKNTVEDVYNQEKTRKEALGFDFMLVQSSVRTYEELSGTNLKPLETIQALGRALGTNLRIDTFESKIVESDQNNRAIFTDIAEDGQETKRNRYEAIFSVSFPSSIDPEVGVIEINNLVERLRQLLPDHEVEILKQVADLSYTGDFEEELSDLVQDETGTPLDYEARIKIAGDV